MAATPGITSRVLRIVEPSDIRSATLLPSRAPSRISSVMMATASGWLSLSPLARRLRASSAAEKMVSRSSSVGVSNIAIPLNSQTIVDVRGPAVKPRRQPKA